MKPGRETSAVGGGFGHGQNIYSQNSTAKGVSGYEGDRDAGNPSSLSPKQTVLSLVIH